MASVLTLLPEPSRRWFAYYPTMPTFPEHLFQHHINSPRTPSPRRVVEFMTGLLGMLFPELSDHRYGSLREFENRYEALFLDLNELLQTLQTELRQTPDDLETAFRERLPDVHKMLIQDAEAINSGDPAASSRTEVIRTYPGFFALAVHRLAHEFYRMEVPLIPRILSEYAHSLTGIDIHPGATIEENFCIDHGTGIVIGETAHIGRNVKMYQNVTLGALSVRKDLAQTKRHPTIEEGVVIYAGATILGGDTTVGAGSVIGGNVWLTKSVPPNSRIYYQGLMKTSTLDTNGARVSEFLL